VAALDTPGLVLVAAGLADVADALDAEGVTP